MEKIIEFMNDYETLDYRSFDKKYSKYYTPTENRAMENDDSWENAFESYRNVLRNLIASIERDN